MNKKGFTLIEMIVTIVIVTILASLAIPSTLKYIKEYQNEKYIVDANKVYIEAQMFVVRKQVQFEVKSIQDTIQYTSCDTQSETTSPFMDAIMDLYDCEEHISLYQVQAVSMELNHHFQIQEFKVDYRLDGSVKTVVFDVDGNASVIDA